MVSCVLMSRLEFHHIAWSRTEASKHRFDLADSAVQAPDLEAMGLPHTVAVPRRPAAESLAVLEHALANRIAAPGGRVLVTTGASEANACVYTALLAAGDRVVAEVPGYEPHRALALMTGATLDTFPRTRDREYSNFADALESRLMDDTRMVVVSHLNNPTGAALTEDDLHTLARVAERRGLWVLCDETFRHVTGPPFDTFARLGPRWICTGSLTKAYGLGSLKIGWITGSDEVLARCTYAQHGLTGNTSQIAVDMASALAPHLDTLLDRARTILARNHDAWRACMTRIAHAADGFDPGIAPRGTTTWCRFEGERRGDEFAAYASRGFDLAITPGRFFGDPRGFRVGLGSEPAAFAASLEQFERALAQFAAEGARTGVSA